MATTEDALIASHRCKQHDLTTKNNLITKNLIAKNKAIQTLCGCMYRDGSGQSS